jgi:hypothetical protein
MSSVPKSRREKHDFMASHKLREIRKLVTELAINDFGYDKDRLEKKIKRFEDGLTNMDPERKADIVRRMREKNESYYANFVAEETIETRKILRKITQEFELGNSIFPSGDALLMEYCEKRKHLDNAIGWLYCLKQELQYIAETLPGDKNRFEYLTGVQEDERGEIENEISLIKGVRRAANKFLKAKKKKNKGNS